MATDPQRWAAQFGQNMMQKSAQDDAATQNMLMALFQEESARQRPYAVLPAQAALNNIQLKQQAALQPDPSIAAENAWQTFQREQALRHRYSMEQIAARGENSQILQELRNAGGGSSGGNNVPKSAPYQEDGQWYVDLPVLGEIRQKSISAEVAHKMLQGSEHE
jgi:hypothetical protein